MFGPIEKYLLDKIEIERAIHITLIDPEKITAQQMLELGLINKICKPDELIPYAREQALKLVPPKGPSLALKMMKRALHKPLTQFISDALDMENKGLRKTAASKDFSESLKALKEKRESKFVGK